MKVKFKQKSLSQILSVYGVYIALLVIFVALSLSTESFLTVTNLFNILKQNVVYGIVAIGMTFVIITGGIDLSVGAIVAIAGCFATSLAKKEAPHPLIYCFIVAIATGVALGAFNGFFIAYMRIPAFIATLATQTIARGIVYVFTDGRPITGFMDSYKVMGRSSVGPVPILVIVYAVLLILGIFLLNFTKYGQHVFAVGGNRKAAIVSGINAKRTELIAYIICGVTAAIAGLLLSSRIQTGQPTSGEGYEQDAITAVVIGGGSLAGGKGSVFGSFIGILVVGLMTNGLNLLNVSSYYQQIIKGAIIILAVMMDRNKD